MFMRKITCLKYQSCTWYMYIHSNSTKLEKHHDLQPSLSELLMSTEAMPTTTTPSTSSSSSTASGRLLGQSDAGPIRAPAPMWRCSRIMHMQRELHPTILSSLEGIVDQMVWFRENWYEEVLRQLRQGLTKCYAVAFENRASGTDLFFSL